MNSITVFLLVSSVLGGPVNHTGESRGNDRAVIDLCIVSPIHDIDVPAKVAGPLVSVAVKEGNTVDTGMQLAQIDDRQSQLDRMQAELRRDAALKRASDDASVKVAQASHDVAVVELAQRMKIRQRSRDAISDSEIRQLELARDRTGFEIERAKLNLQVERLNADREESAVKAAEHEIALRRITSPIDGEVVTVIRQTGEWVAAGDPVFRVIRMDRLRVEGIVSSRNYNPGELMDRAVTVELELARGRKVPLSGRVVHISPIVKAGSKYRIRAEVANQREQSQWLLRPGSTVSMAIHLK